MEKQTIRIELNYYLDWRYEVTIEKLKQDITELEKLGATHVCIDAWSSYDTACLNINAIIEREETDKEMKDRVAKENARLDALREQELEQLRRLQEKYHK